MNFIIISLSEPKSYDIDNLSIKAISNTLLIIFICIMIKQGLCMCGESSHLESYKSTEYIPNWKKYNMLLESM